MLKILGEFTETDIILTKVIKDTFINFETSQTITRETSEGKIISKDFLVKFIAVKGDDDWETINIRINNILDGKTYAKLYINYIEIDNNKYKNYYILKNDSNGLLYQAIKTRSPIIDYITSKFKITMLN